jgi:hypothetical protein
VLFWCGLQEREAGDGGEVDGCDVGVVGGIPVFGGFGVPEFLLERTGGGGVGDTFGTWDAGGGDEEGKVFLFGGDFFDEVIEGVFGGYVGGDGNDLAREGLGVRGVAFGSVFEDFLAAACDIYFGSFWGRSVEAGGRKVRRRAVSCQDLGCHQTDPTSAPCNKTDIVLKREKVADMKVFCGCHGEGSLEAEQDALEVEMWC